MVLVQVRWFGTGTWYRLENLHQGGKRIKTKSHNFWGLIPAFLEVIGEKGLRTNPNESQTSKVETLKHKDDEIIEQARSDN